MTESPSSSSTASSDADTVARGVVLWIFLLIASHLPVFVMNGVVEIPGLSVPSDCAYTAAMWAGFFGVTQLVTVVPAVIVLLVRRRRAMLKGVLLSAGVVFTLNSLCAAIVMLG